MSLEPPLVLVCIDKRARLHDPLAGGQPFAINMLAADQEVLSRRFAASGPDQFAGVGYTTSSEGTAWLDDTLAVIECSFVEKYPGGDHTIVVGQVEATRDSRREAAALFPWWIRTIGLSASPTRPRRQADDRPDRSDLCEHAARTIGGIMPAAIRCRRLDSFWPLLCVVAASCRRSARTRRRSAAAGRRDAPPKPTPLPRAADALSGPRNRRDHAL